MRAIDPDVELVLCGSSHHAMPTFGVWEATVLELRRVNDAEHERVVPRR